MGLTARFRSASRHLFVATWSLAAVLALAGCAPSHVKEPAAGAQAQAATGNRTGQNGAPVVTAPAEPAGGALVPIPIPPEGLLTTPGAKVQVGLLLPLSGADAGLGRLLLEAAELAVFEVADNSFELLPRDTGGTPDGARAAATDAIRSGAKLLLGPVFAADVTAVTPLARTAGLSVIAFSNDRTVAGSGVYVLGVPPAQPITRVVNYAAAHGITRFAGLVPDNAFGQRVSDDLKAAVARAGGSLAGLQVYRRSQEDMAQAVRHLADWDARRRALADYRKSLAKESPEVAAQALRRIAGADTYGPVGFDAVLLPETGRPLQALAPLLPYYDIDTRKVKVLGFGDWRDSALLHEPSLAGAWVAGLSPETWDAFAQRFSAAFGHAPHRLGTLAYDAVALAAVLAQGDKGPDFGTAALTARNGFSGADGIFRLDPDGTVEHGLAVMEVERDRLKVIDPAPQSFPQAGI